MLLHIFANDISTESMNLFIIELQLVSLKQAMFDFEIYIHIWRMFRLSNKWCKEQGNKCIYTVLMYRPCLRGDRICYSHTQNNGMLCLAYISMSSNYAY